MFEEGGDVPASLARDLRQQQATAQSAFDDQTMASDFNLIRRLHLARRAQDRDFDRQLRKFGDSHWWKPRIGVCHRASKMSDDTSNRPVGFQTSETTAQIAAVMD